MPSLINSDDGVVSGTSGLKTTGGNDGLLNIQTNGTNAISIDASQNITLAAGSKNLTLQQTSAAGANSTSYPGYIAFTGFGWNTSLGSQPLGIRLAAGGNYTPDLGQVAPGLSISTQNTNGAMTQRMLLNGYGIGLGNGTYPISGMGIKFPATQSASSDANTLDDYEEGSWTPVDASGAGLSFSSPSGTYVKIGGVAICSYRLMYPSNSSVLSAYVGGLPFSNSRYSFPTGYTGYNSGTGFVVNHRMVTATAFFISNAATGGDVSNQTMSGRELQGTIIIYPD